MDNAELLWYKRPAADWNEALAVGNGRIGGMIFGRTSDELVSLNEDSLWSGGYRDRNNPEAYKNLEKIRNLIRAGLNGEAEELCRSAFFGTNDQQRHYLPLGDLHIRQSCGESSEYKRTLELSSAVSTVGFQCDGVNFRREYFVSAPDNCLAIIFTADKPASVSFSASIDGRDDNYDKNEAYDDCTVLFTVSDGIPYAAAVSASVCGGSGLVEANRVRVENADSALLVVAAQSAYRTGDYEKLCISQAKRALRVGAEKLKARHIADYKRLYCRCALKLEDNSGGNAELPTDERLEKIRSGGRDNKLTEMYFNFSRYLMISGSRAGTLPLNLQGIWNKDMWPAWGCKYTVNINTEMNYWGAEIQNLSECHTPLFDHIERMRENGRVTARKMYRCRGTVCHHNTDIWGDTAPQDTWMPGTQWPMGMAWLCLHIYEHYLFTCDREFLAEKYDTMREAAEFFEDFLIDDGSGRLVTSPSVSPENTFFIDAERKGTLCQGPSMDSFIIYSLFSAVISSAEILGIDAEFARKLAVMREKLPKPEIGKYGQIKEWAEDYDETEPGHRHISQLFSLYPADIITLHDTPKLAAAAKATLERRLSHGGGHTGWSRAWIINMWARLGEGEKVGENITALLSNSTSANMFDMHPPFQIDGNFGGGAGIAEALLQSQGGKIELMPAVPKQWECGSLRGFMARGGFEVSYSWKNGEVISAEIISHSGGDCVIYSKKPLKIICNEHECPVFQNDNNTYTFTSETGYLYAINYC